MKRSMAIDAQITLRDACEAVIRRELLDRADEIPLSQDELEFAVSKFADLMIERGFRIEGEMLLPPTNH